MRNVNCSSCELHVNVNNVCLWGEGPQPCDIMILGREPSASDDRHGRPISDVEFTKLLNMWLQEAGLNRANVYISNACKCRTPENRPPTDQEFAACRTYLDQEIATVNPRVIITLGKEVYETLTGEKDVKILARAGKSVDYTKNDITRQILVSAHPSYVSRNPNYNERVRKHFKEFGQIIRGEAPIRSAVRYVTIRNIDQFRKFMAKMREQKLIAFDTETTGFDFQNDRILCYSFSWKTNTAVVLPLLGYKETTIWSVNELEEINTALKTIYADSSITWIAQNISFDHKFLMTAGIMIAGLIEDTMLIQSLCDENALDLKGLKAMAALYTDMGNYDDGLDKCKQQLKIDRRKGLQAAQKVRKDRIKELKKMLLKADPPETTEINWDITGLEGELVDIADENKDITYADIPSEILWPYAAMDADAVIRVHRVLTNRLHDEAQAYDYSQLGGKIPDMVRYYHALVMKQRRVLDTMEYRGAKVNVAYLHELDKVYAAKLEELEQGLLAMPEVTKVCGLLLKKNQKKVEERWAGLKTTIDYLIDPTNTKPPKYTQKEYGIHYGKPIPFNMNSHDHLRLLLFTVLKLKHPFPKKAGKAGNKLSTDKEVLEALENSHPCVKLLQENRKLSKLHKTYVLGQIKRADAGDRIHTSFNQHITVTGRLSSSQPNLQNIPRANKDIKKAFIPTYPEWFIIQMDYAQAEFRMWAELSKDMDMINDIKSGLDIHRATAAQFWSIPEADVTKEQRSAAKFVVFGLMYGRGAESVAKQVKITKEAAEAIIEQFFAKYPIARRWLNITKHFTESTGYSPGYFGRVRRLPYAQMKFADKEKFAMAIRQSVNAPIQGGAADLTGVAMIKIHRELQAHPEWKAHLILTVHDSIILEADPSCMKPVIKMCHQKMTEVVDGMLVPMAAEIEVGPNWGKLVEIPIKNVDSLFEILEEFLADDKKD